jgi:hypothetical protein
VNISRVSELRASDEDRERAATEIREHFAAGRLTDDEMSERLDAVYGARTQRELGELRADLPALPATRAQAQAELAERRRQLRGELIQHTGAALAPFLICTVIWALAGAHGYFWPAWVALAALIPLIRNGWRLYGPAPRLDAVETELARRRSRDHRRRNRRSTR